MKHLLIHISVIFIFLFAGCQQEDLYSPEVEAKENTADYLVNNNSDYDISVSYITSSKLGFKTSNDLIVIPKGSTRKVFEVEFITEFPYPSTALYSLSFYHSDHAAIEIIAANEPVFDEAWEIIDQALDSEGFGHTTYQLSFADVKKD